jgi:hypothetical protein
VLISHSGQPRLAMEDQGRSDGCLQIEQALGLADSLLGSLERLTMVEETD